MSFAILPEEIIIHIIQFLDTKSVKSLYDTCRYLRNIISLPGVVKECQMSMNTLATVNSFKTNFFKAIAPHILELNLCAVPDLRKAYLIPAIKKMKNLQTIDVSFTYLSLTDFLHIYEFCPTIKNVSLNFMLNESGLSKMSNDSLLELRKMFKHFKKVHLLGTTSNILFSQLPSLLLQDAELDTLKYTIIRNGTHHKINAPKTAEQTPYMKFKQFFLCVPESSTFHTYYVGGFFELPLLSKQDLSTIETIILNPQTNSSFITGTCIYTTPTFKNYFQETFDIDECKIKDIELNRSVIFYRSRVVLMMWKKEYHEFDTFFYAKLTKLLNPFFPLQCNKDNQQPCPIKYDRVIVISEEPANKGDNHSKSNVVPHLKRRRTAPSMNVLNYDELFRNMERIELFLTFNNHLNFPVTIPANCEYLQKLTFISITGSVRFSADFFNLLFKSCVNLITANIESPPIFPCAGPISKALSMSPGLKNLRLVDRKIGFNTLFHALAKCRTLENVNVFELTRENVDIGDPSVIIEQCPGLYHLYIQAPMSETTRIKTTQIMNKAKIRCNKHYLNLVLLRFSDHFPECCNGLGCCDPFTNVYNLNPMKEIIDIYIITQ